MIYSPVQLPLEECSTIPLSLEEQSSIPLVGSLEEATSDFSVIDYIFEAVLTIGIDGLAYGYGEGLKFPIIGDLVPLPPLLDDPDPEWGFFGNIWMIGQVGTSEGDPFVLGIFGVLDLDPDQLFNYRVSVGDYIFSAEATENSWPGMPAEALSIGYLYMGLDLLEVPEEFTVEGSQFLTKVWIEENEEP